MINDIKGVQTRLEIGYPEKYNHPRKMAFPLRCVSSIKAEARKTTVVKTNSFINSFRDQIQTHAR